MFLDEIAHFTRLYEKRAKKVSLRTSYPKVESKPLNVELRKFHGNYDLFFNIQGNLLYSEHFESHMNYRIIYVYNSKNNLIAIVNLLLETNEFIEMSEFSYDYKNRVNKEVCKPWMNSSDDEDNDILLHSYYKNGERIIYLGNDHNPDETIESIAYDDKNCIIEKKMVGKDDELYSWSKMEYNKGGALIKEMDLNSNGEVDGVYLFSYLENGLESGYKYTSEELNYTKERIYSYNEKGHWISQSLMNDGVPQFFYDRTIEYFS